MTWKTHTVSCLANGWLVKTETSGYPPVSHVFRRQDFIAMEAFFYASHPATIAAKVTVAAPRKARK